MWGMAKLCLACGLGLKGYAVLLQMQRKQGTLQMALSRTGCLLQLSNQGLGAYDNVQFSLTHPNGTASR